MPLEFGGKTYDLDKIIEVDSEEFGYLIMFLQINNFNLKWGDADFKVSENLGYSGGIHNLKQYNVLLPF